MSKFVSTIMGIILIGQWLSSEANLTLPIQDGAYNRYGQSDGSNEWLPRYDNIYDVEIGKIRVLSHILKEQIDEFRLDANNKVDNVFLVDASSSVGEDNFRSELNFVRKLLSDQSVGDAATRVAVVTFGGRGMVSRNIDQITSAEYAGDKCLLLNQQLGQINYTGGGTYTRGALTEALAILQEGREDARKVIFLITDGFSNGGDPRPIAQQLKNLGAVILTFGIRTGNVEELHDIASVPGYTHSYLLDSFKEFEALARHALHRDLTEDQYIVLNSKDPCRILCTSADNGTTDENCCDDIAECACGSTSGHYTCLCPIGYYGSGLKGNCHPCPNGTYGQAYHPGDASSNCLPCPTANHITLTVPAISPEACVCSSGFISTTDSNCQAITCPKLKVPENGYLVKASACHNVVNAACGLRCRIGFQLVGDSIRLCRQDGHWSGTKTRCVLKTCSALRAPAHGQVDCEYDEEYENQKSLGLMDLSWQWPIDARCQFKCNQGYQLLGSKVRNCLPVSRWDGLKVTCKQIKCDPLKSISNSIITPESCLAGKKLAFGTTCNISCTNGFVLQGPAVRRCTGSSGLWSQRHIVNKCIDKTPPVIKCPANSTWNTLPGKKYSLPTWTPPIVSDNSDEAVHVWTKPHITLPWKGIIGEQVVTYIAEDTAGNRARCRFSIKTEDDEPPQVEHCMDPPIFLVAKINTGSGDNITWNDPVFHDNSGSAVEVGRSHDQGSSFPIGTTQVTYTAKDLSNNVRQCIINITIRNICDEPPVLSNGDARCEGSSEGAIQCVITCDEGYIFPLTESQFTGGDYASASLPCNDPDMWNMYSQLPLSCSITEYPQSVESTLVVTLESETSLCSQPALLESLKHQVQQDISFNLPEACSTNGLACNSSTFVNLNCSQSSPEGPGIHRRSVGGGSTKRKRDKIEITMRFVGRIIAEHRQDPQAGIEKLRNELLALTKSGKINLLNENTNREIANLALNLRVLFDPDVKEICDAGKVMRKFKCAKCPVGSFHNTTSGLCEACRLSEYQDKPGSTFCHKCPVTMSTRRLRSTSRQDCVAICRHGYYSRRKYHRTQQVSLEPCIPCEIGTYQPEEGTSACLPCPMNHSTTNSSGSISVDQCRAATASTNPCHSDSCLNNGTCIPEDFGFSCECLEGFIGSQCQQIKNPCDSSPCLNQGHCHTSSTPPSLSSYFCSCVDGFTGTNCEIYVDECASGPCQNAGTCVSTENDYHCRCPDGFGGEVCETALDVCQGNVCEEGSSCVAVDATWKCLCKPGFFGRRCQLLPCDLLPCHPNAICVNVQQANATHHSFKCNCPPGFMGYDCLTRIDHCGIVTSCQNSGTCINSVTGFSCKCPPGFDGSRCQIKLSRQFVLKFAEPGTTDFILMQGPEEDLAEFSICLWIQSEDTWNYATVFSYATPSQDNTITLTDINNGLVFYVNGGKAVTDITLNDGLWHFLCVTWAIAGAWSIYVDGVLKQHGEHLAPGLGIPGNGSIVIGQEQDYIGGGFSPSESFLGRITLLDAWGSVLSEEFIKHISETCEDYSGTLVTWSSVQKNIHGNVKLLDTQFCHVCSPPLPPYRGFLNMSEDGLTAVYSCESGYQFYRGYKSQTIVERRCLKQGQWEDGEVLLICSRVHCGFPGYLPRGRVFGRSYYFGDEVYYNCAEGYELRGNPHRVCNADARWTGRPPICIGITCKNLLAPKNGDIEYIIEEHERDDITILQVGQQLEFRCNGGFQLVGESILTCSRDGQWDHDVPKCEPLMGCPLPATPAHASFNISGQEDHLVDLGDVVLLTCSAEFVFSDGTNEHSLECSANGTWSGILADCHPAACVVPSIPNGKPRNAQEQITTGGKLFFQCDEGFKPAENHEKEGEVTCQESGNWSATPACQPVKCPGISTHPIASLFVNRSQGITRMDQLTLAVEGDKLGDHLILHCSDETQDLIVNNTEYRNMSWRCDEGFAWTRQPHPGTVNIDDVELRRLLLIQDLCETGKCPAPTAPTNGLIVSDHNVTEWRVNATVSHRCNSGFSLQGLGRATCTAEGSWSGLSLCKPISCLDGPFKLVNARVNGEVDGSSYLAGDIVTYECQPGFRLHGQRISRCLNSGKWSRVQGHCSRISCGKPKVPGVRLEGKSYLYQDRIGYACESGRRGEITCLADGQWSQILDC